VPHLGALHHDHGVVGEVGQAEPYSSGSNAGCEPDQCICYCSLLVGRKSADESEEGGCCTTVD